MIRTTKEDYAQVIPSVSKTITCHHKTMKRFDSILEDTDLIDYQLDQARCRSLNSLATVSYRYSFPKLYHSTNSYYLNDHLRDQLIINFDVSLQHNTFFFSGN